MTDTTNTFEEKLEALRRDYVSRLPQRILDIEARWRALKDRPPDEAALAALLRAAHSLAGSGTTFGLPEVTENARALETALKALYEDGEGPAHGDHRRVEDLLTALRSICFPQDGRVTRGE